MTSNSQHVRMVAAVLSVGAVTLVFQAVRTADPRLITGLIMAAVALVAVAGRMWRLKLVVTDTGIQETRIFGPRTANWADINDFYLGRPPLAGGLCVWVVCHDGREYSLHSTWRADRVDDVRAADALVEQLRGRLAATRTS